MADNMAEDAARPLSPAQQHEEEEEHVEAADVEVGVENAERPAEAAREPEEDREPAAENHMPAPIHHEVRDETPARGPQHRQVERRRLLTEMDETPERMVRAPNELLRK